MAHTTYRDPSITSANSPDVGTADVPVTPQTPLPVAVVGTAASGGPVPSATVPVAPWIYAGVTGGIVDTTDVPLRAAGVVRNYLYGLQYINSSATASEIVIKDGPTTVLWRGFAPASAAGGMVTITFNPPLVGSVSNALNVAMITTATATRVSAQGFTGA